jgi:hypothetical protein
MRRNSDDFRSEIEAHIRIEADRNRERGRRKMLWRPRGAHSAV